MKPATAREVLGSCFIGTWVPRNPDGQCGLQNSTEIATASPLPVGTHEKVFRILITLNRLAVSFWHRNDWLIDYPDLVTLRIIIFYWPCLCGSSTKMSNGRYIFFNTVQRRRSQHARTLIPMNTRTQTLPLWASSKIEPANHRDWKSHHMCLAVDGNVNVPYHWMHNAVKS